MLNNKGKNVPASGSTPKNKAKYSQYDNVDGSAQITDKMQSQQYQSDKEIEFNSHLQKKNAEASNARTQPNMRRQSPTKKGQAGPKSLQLTEQNRKMIKQMKDRQNKKPLDQPKGKAPNFGHELMSDKSLQKQMQSQWDEKRVNLVEDPNQGLDPFLRKQIDIELPQSCRYQQVADGNDQFTIQQASLDDFRGAGNLAEQSAPFEDSNMDRFGGIKMDMTPPKGKANKFQKDGAKLALDPIHQQEDQGELFGTLDISPIENIEKEGQMNQKRPGPESDFEDSQRPSMAKKQLQHGQVKNVENTQQMFQEGKMAAPFDTTGLNDEGMGLKDGSDPASNKRAKENFMNNLQVKLRNLSGNQDDSQNEQQYKSGSGKRGGEVVIKKKQDDVANRNIKKDAATRETAGNIEATDEEQRKNVILDVLELELLTQTAQMEQAKVGHKEQASVKKATQSSSVGPRADEKCSNSASSNSQKRKQSQPKQGEKVQINSAGLPQHSSSDSSGGSQAEAGATGAQANSAAKPNPVLPYPNAQADALAFLKEQKLTPKPDGKQADNEADNGAQAEDNKRNQPSALPFAKKSQQEINQRTNKEQANENGQRGKGQMDGQQEEVLKMETVPKRDPDGKAEEAFIPIQSMEVAAPAQVENEFQSYFQEMNDKANEVMARSQPEPEKALEFLKQVEEFLKKIQQGQKAAKSKLEQERKKHIKTEANDTERRSPKCGSVIGSAKDDSKLNEAAKIGALRASYEQSLTQRVTQDKRALGFDDDLANQASGSDFKNLMGMSPVNMINDDIDDENYVFHTIYRTTPCSFTVGTVVVEDAHQNLLQQRAKTSLSTSKQRHQILDDQQLRDHNGTSKNPQTEANQPYKIQYTVSQLNSIDVDPTFKVILFYNMACCYQRLHLNDECTQYLESATKALQERIRLLENQEQTLLHQNLNQPVNAVNIIYASSRNSVKQYDDAREDKQSTIQPSRESSEMPNLVANFNLRNQNEKASRSKDNSTSNFYQQKRAQHPFHKQANNEDLGAAAAASQPADQMNHLTAQPNIGGNVNQHNRAASISQTRISTTSELQLQNFKYEKLLAQKMQSLRYQCKLHLQICAVMSQQGLHRDALIFGNKSSHLCYQLIKDAQLLCKRQMQQIRRQRKLLDYDSEEDIDEEGDHNDAESDQDGVYGEMGGAQTSGNPMAKRQVHQKFGTMHREAENQKQNAISDEQSMNSYSIKSMRTKDRHQKKKKIPKYKRARSNSTHNSVKKNNETVEQITSSKNRLEPLSQTIQQKFQTQTASTTQRNSPKKKQGKGSDNSRKSHSSDSKQRNNQAGFQNIQLGGGVDGLSPNVDKLALTQHAALARYKDGRMTSGGNQQEKQRRDRSRNHQQLHNQNRACVSESNRTEQSCGSSASYYSSNSLARIKIRRAFDNQSKSSAGKSGTTSQQKTRNRFHARDNSVSSQMSQESLKKIYSFALKNAKSLNQLQNEQDATEGDKKLNKQKKKKNGDNKKERAKVYYVEEQVKVLSEIIQMADPILTELSSQIFQFEKLTEKKTSYRQRDVELYRRYGQEDFMAERDKLNISFHNLKEIKAIQQIKKFKIAVRNTLGLKQLDDWIYNLNIGNVMHLSLMSADELQPIENGNLHGTKHSQINSVVGSTQGRLQSALELEQATTDGFYGKNKDEKEDMKQHEKNLFETSHDLCKDAMLEKIVLISVAYFCIATEMRFIIQKQKQQKSLQKKDSEMYHAKALHISSLFLPKECPLVQHITQSYNKNYLKDKPEFNLERYLTEDLGIDLSEEGDEDHAPTVRTTARNQEDRSAEQRREKSKRAPAQHQKSTKDYAEEHEIKQKQLQQLNNIQKAQIIVPVQLQASKHSPGSPGKTPNNNDESHRLSSENNDMDEGTTVVTHEPVKASKMNNRVKESLAVKKACINQIKKSPAISKVHQGSLNTMKNMQGQQVHNFNSFAKRGSMQVNNQNTLSMERIKFSYKPGRNAQNADSEAAMFNQEQMQADGSNAHKQKKAAAANQARLPPQTALALQSPAPAGGANSKSLQHLMASKHHGPGKANINNRIVPVSRVGGGLGQKGMNSKAGMSANSQAKAQAPSTTKHGVQRHYINLSELEDKNSQALHKNKQAQKKPVESSQRLNTDGQVQQQAFARASSRGAISTQDYLRQSQEQMAAEHMQSPKQTKKKFEGLLNFFYKKD